MDHTAGCHRLNEGMENMMGWMSAQRPRGTKRMPDTTGAYDGGATGVMSGLIEGTRVATAMGWRPIEAIAVGDKVLTFDAGLQPVTRIERRALWSGESACPARFWPLEVPAGALGNRDVMHILPNQGVMLESDAAELAYDDPFALVPALALEGVNGIHRTPPRPATEVLVLHFETDQVVFANSGALFFAPSSRDLLDRAFGDQAAAIAATAQGACAAGCARRGSCAAARVRVLASSSGRT